MILPLPSEDPPSESEEEAERGRWAVESVTDEGSEPVKEDEEMRYFPTPGGEGRIGTPGPPPDPSQLGRVWEGMYT